MIISIDAGVIFYYDFQTLTSVQPLSHVEMEQVAKTPEEDTVVLVLKDSLAKIATRVRGFPNFSCDESALDAVSICYVLYYESDLPKGRKRPKRQCIMISSRKRFHSLKTPYLT